MLKIVFLQFEFFPFFVEGVEREGITIKCPGALSVLKRIKIKITEKLFYLCVLQIKKNPFN